MTVVVVVLVENSVHYDITRLQRGRINNGECRRYRNGKQRNFKEKGREKDDALTVQGSPWQLLAEPEHNHYSTKRLLRSLSIHSTSLLEEKISQAPKIEGHHSSRRLAIRLTRSGLPYRPRRSVRYQCPY